MIKYVPPTVTHLFVHYRDRKQTPVDRAHYLFNEGADNGFANNDLAFVDNNRYSIGEVYTDVLFGITRSILLRMPKDMCVPIKADITVESHPIPVVCSYATEVEVLRAEVASLKAIIESLTQTRST